MTKKNKDLFLRDLCARLPYGIICKCTYPVNNETTDGEDVLFTNDYEIEGIRRVGAGFAGDRRWYEITFNGETYDINDDGIKVVPYLRPMSSMTEEEKQEYDALFYKDEEGASICNNDVWFDFMNSHFLDYRGFIEKGIALEAPEWIYK